HVPGSPWPDRLLSRWAIVRKNSNDFDLLSTAHYADDIRPKWDLPQEKPRGKKGLGALWPGRPLSDLDDLGISAVTVNINLNSFMRMTGQSDGSFEYAGRRWYVDDNFVGQLDDTLLEAARRRLIVSAIILVGQAKSAPDRQWGRLIAHPDAAPSGVYV